MKRKNITRWSLTRAKYDVERGRLARQQLALDLPFWIFEEVGEGHSIVLDEHEDALVQDAPPLADVKTPLERFVTVVQQHRRLKQGDDVINVTSCDLILKHVYLCLDDLVRALASVRQLSGNVEIQVEV